MNDFIFFNFENGHHTSVGRTFDQGPRSNFWIAGAEGASFLGRGGGGVGESQCENCRILSLPELRKSNQIHQLHAVSYKLV